MYIGGEVEMYVHGVLSRQKLISSLEEIILLNISFKSY